MTKITSNINDVLAKISGKEDFIAIGELHNSRSAIKFIMDNITKLALNDSRKTYLLSEILGLEESYDSGKKGDNGKKNRTMKELNQEKVKLRLREREMTRQAKDTEENKYTLLNLYLACIDNNINIVSIEHDSRDNEEIKKGLRNGDLDIIEKRTNYVNRRALRKALEIWEVDETARILIFAGMGHIANSTCKKLNGNQFTSTKSMTGITELLRSALYQGLSINVHDPLLCDEPELLTNFACDSESYTKYAASDSYVSVDSPDFLLFLNAQPPTELYKDETHESMFYIGECNEPNDIKDKNLRVQNLTPYVPITDNPELEADVLDQAQPGEDDVAKTSADVLKSNWVSFFNSKITTQEAIEEQGVSLNAKFSSEDKAQLKNEFPECKIQ